MARHSIIGVRVDEDQRGQFERAAKSAGKSVSEWLRDLGAAAAPELKKGDRITMAGKSYPDLPLSPELERISSEIAKRAVRDLVSDNPLPSTLKFLESNPEARAWRELLRLENNRRKDEIENGLAVGTGYMRVVDSPPDVVLGSPLTDARSARAIELASSIPGLMVGFGAPGTGRGLFNPEHPIPLTGYAEKVEARREELKAEGVDVLEQLFPADTPEDPVRSWSEQLPMLLKLSEGDANEELLRLTSGDHPPSKYAQWYRNPKMRPDLIRWLDERYELEAVVEVENPLTDSKGDGW